MPMDTAVLFETIQKKGVLATSTGTQCVCCVVAQDHDSLRSDQASQVYSQSVRKVANGQGVCAGSSYRVT